MPPWPSPRGRAPPGPTHSHPCTVPSSPGSVGARQIAQPGLRGLLSRCVPPPFQGWSSDDHAGAGGGVGGVRGRAAGSHPLPLSFSQHCPGFCRRKPRRWHGAGPSRPSVATQKHHVQEVRGKALMTALKPDRPSPGTRRSFLK